MIFLFCIAGISFGKSPRILVFSETAGWDHQTRTGADSVIRNLGIVHGFDVSTTSVSDGYFTDDSLAAFKAVCFINTTGSIFTAMEKQAFERYIKNGGGYAGMHASTDCEYEWKWYGNMTGANFNGHPFNSTSGKIAVLNRNHLSTAHITADTLVRTDEWYFWGKNPDFRNNPLIDPAENSDVHVLMELVESSIPGSNLNHNHPICWYREFENGRVWYCGFGHDPQTFNDTLIKKMLLGGICYAAGIQPTGIITRSPILNKEVSISAGKCRFLIHDFQGRVINNFTFQVPFATEFSNLLTIKEFKRIHLSSGAFLVKVVQNSNHFYTKVPFLFRDNLQ